MGTITTGIGLISGINTGALIDSLITLESQGKVRLQERLANVQAQQAAMLDINSRLLLLKTAARALRQEKVFDSMLATSSDPDVLTAVADKTAQPGIFSFIVSRLVSTSQKMTRGYVDSDTTPLGLSQLTFEFGHGQVGPDTDLINLNGGAGVDRGRILITDRSGATATIDLSDVTTLNEVIERINDASTIDVTASAAADHLVITDNTGQTTSNLIVANAAGDTTATDLGIVGSVAAAALTGTDIVSIGSTTAIASLGDGNGVLIRDNVPDLSITARDGTIFDVDLGRIDLPITGTTLLSELNNGAGVTISTDGDNPDITFVARDGTQYDVDLTGVTTVGGLITRVSSETGGHIALSIHADGDKLTVTDTISGAGNLQVLGAGTNGTDTAEDLGILETVGVAADSFDGDIIPNTISAAPVATIQELIDRINTALDTTGAPNAGHIVASIAPDGVSLQITDTVSGAGNLIVASTAGNPDAAGDLGIAQNVAADTISGTRLIAGLNTVLAGNLNGGSGLSGATTITISDRDNDSVTLNNLDTYDSLSEIIDAINNADPTVDVTVTLNDAGNGLLVTDTSGGTNNLTVTGDAATALGIAGDVTTTTIRGTNLQHQYVSNATRLEDLNYGRGVGTGGFTITDGFGNTATVSIGGTETTLYDVILEINSKGLAVNARVNDNGDGLLIEEDLTGFTGTPSVKMKVVAAGGTTAADLNILGESAVVVGGKIDGSYERSVSVATSDTLADLATKINDAGIPVAASVINTGSGATPYRLNFSSELGGRAGELSIDTGSVDLGLTALTTGRDAKVFFGATDPADALLITSPSNTVDDIVQGLTVTLHAASSTPQTVTIERDEDTIVDAVETFVNDFNDAIAKIDLYDFYNSETEERGALLGNPITSLVRTSLFRTLRQQATGVTTQFQYLSQVGIRVGSNGQVTFDKDEFLAAYESDPQAVENLFAAFQGTTTTSTEVSPGITVNTTTQTYTTLGFSDLFDQLLEGMTNSTNGTMTLADDAFDDQIEIYNDRIETFDERLAARRARLEAEFANMELALARLQEQSTALQALTSNLLLAQTLGVGS